MPGSLVSKAARKNRVSDQWNVWPREVSGWSEKLVGLSDEN